MSGRPNSQASDITKRKKVQQKPLDAELAVDIIEAIPDGVVMVGMDSKVTFINKAFEKILGYNGNEIVGISAEGMLTYRNSKDEKKARQALKMVIEKGSTEPVDIIALTKDGREIPISFSASAIKDDRGNPKTLVTVIRDITKQKKAEEALQQSEEYFRTLMENSIDAVVILNEDGTIRYESPSYKRLLGFTAEEKVGSNLFERIHPDDITRVGELFAEFLQNRGGIIHTEVRARHKDGSWRVMEATGSNLLYNPVVKGIAVNLRDITERRQMEEALREGELLATATIEGMADGVMLVGIDGKVAYINKAFEKILRYKAEELVGTSAVELPTYRGSKDKKKARQALKRVIEKGDAEPIDMIALSKDGEEIPISFSASVIKDAQGNPKTLVAVIRDVTERKKAEEALRQSEERFRRVLDNAIDMIYWVNLKTGTYDYVSPSSEKVLGYTPDEFIALGMAGGISLAHPDDLERLNQNIIDSLMNAGNGNVPSAIEYRFAHKKLGYRWMFDNRSIVYDGDEPVAIVGSFRDITERKKMEEEVQQSELNYRVLFDSTLDGLFVIDAETMKVALANEPGMRLAKIYGFDSLTDLNIADMVEFFHPDDRDRVIKTIAEDMFEKDLRQINEFRMLTKDGREMWISAVGTITKYQGKLAGLVSMRDITKRKQMEEELRLLSDAVKMTTDSVAVADMRGRILDINEAGLRMYGLSDRADFVGRNPIDAIAPEDRRQAIENMAKLIETGQVKDIEYHVLRKDGSKILIETSVSVIRGGNGEPRGLVAVARDITERKRAGESIRRNYEIQTVLNDLLRTSLTGISLEEQLQLFLEHIVSIDSFGLEAKGSVFLVEGDPDVLVLKAQKGLAEPLLAMCARVPFGRCLCGRAALSGEAQFADCLDERHENRYEGITQHGHYCVPIMSDNKVLGVINLYVGEGHTRDEMEEGFIRAVSDVIAGIIQRKKAEEALKQSEKRYRQLFESMQEGLWLIDKDSITTFVNPRMAEILGYTAEEMLGKHLFEFMDERGIEAAKYNLERRSQGIKEQHDFEFIRKDGARVYASLETSPISDEAGNYVGALACVADITERKKAGEALKLSEERYRLVVDNASEAIVVAQDGMTKFLNSRAIGMLGYSKEEITSKPFIKLVHPDDQQMVAGRYMARLRGEELPAIYSFRVVDKAGNFRWVEINAVVINWDGRPATLNFLTDITERKRAEEEKQKMEEQLRLAGRLAAVGELAAGVAHELNNPLAIIQMYSEFYKERGDLNDTAKKDLLIIYEQAERASKITRNLLSFARKHEPERNMVSVNEIIEKTLEMRSHQMSINNIEVSKKLQPDLPMTMADYNQMQQVFMNIIINAEQAMLEAHGRGKLNIKTETTEGMIKISLTDDGPGISEGNLKRIFDPFFTTKEVGKGTGLGLSICYGIVQAHGGRIYVISKMGEGATFVIEIPITSEYQEVSEIENLSLVTGG